MAEEIKYLLATEADIPLLLQMRKQFSDELAGELAPEIEHTLTESQTAYFTRELNKSYFCWYVTVNGDAAAIAAMVLRQQPGNPKNISGRWAYLLLVFTKPEYRRRGFSCNLIQRLIGTGTEMGITAFELHATQQGEHVYIKNGFSIYPEPTYRMFTDINSTKTNHE